MITWHYANGELTWQAVLLLTDGSVILAFILFMVIDGWLRRRRRLRYFARLTTRIQKGDYR